SDNKKHIVNLESFMEMLHICLRVHGQSFDEPPFEEEILAFIHFLGHSAAIRMLTDVNINKLYQPCRSFEAIINKCLTGKSFGYDSLRLSQAQILWGLYHKRNVDYAYLMWEDFDLSIPRRNKVNWHYVRDNHMFSTIKLVSRHQNMQQFGALLPIELTNEEIRNSNAYKEYYAIATRAAPPKPKASVKRTRSSSDTSITPLTAVASPRLIASAKGKQTAKFKAKSLYALSEVAMTEAQQLKLVTKRSMKQTHISQASGSGTDEGTGSISEGRGIQATLEVEDSHVTLTLINPDGMESIFKTTSQLDVQTPTSVAPLPMTTPTITPSTIATITTTSQRMNEAVKVAVQIQSDRLRDKAQRENEEFLKTVDANMQKIIKEQIKEQVKVQVSKILPRIEQAVNEQHEAEVLTQSSHSSRTSYVVVADLSEMELKKILIEKMEGNKDDEMMMLIRMKNPPLDQTEGQRDAEKERILSQQALQWKLVPGALAELLAGPTYELMKGSCKSLVELEYHLEEVFKAITDQLDWVNPEGGKRQQFYGFAVNQEFARDVYSKRRIIAVTELKIVKWHSYKHLDWITVRRDDDKLYKFKEVDFKRLRIQDIKDMLLLLVQRKLTNLTVEERFAFNVSLRMFTRSIVIQRCVEDLQLGVKSYQKKLNLTKPDSYRSDLKCKEAYTAYSNPRGFIYQNKDKKNRLMRIDELHKFSDGTLIDVRTALDDRLKGIQMQRIIAFTELKIVEWHNYKHLYRITVRREDDKLYKFKEGDFKRLRIQDIEDIIVIQRRVEDLQLGVESYQKKLNLTKLDSYRSDLKRKDAYTAYSNPRRFIYQNKDKTNRLMRINELHKFSNETLTDVRTTLDDRLKGIQMQYLPQSI
nr:hypothetical protein [Tanacetum cinerariifolium]